MATEIPEKTVSLMQTVTRLLDTALNQGTSWENLTNVLSLICIVSILNRNQPATLQASPQSAAANPLTKLLGDLTKGEGGPSPDALMSLLPLLNSPQIKSKLNPATISSVLGMLGNMGGVGGGDKQEPAKQEKQEEKQEARKPAEAPEEPDNHDNDTEERRGQSRSLNWKSNF